MKWVIALKTETGLLEVRDQKTGEVYGEVASEAEIVDLVVEKTGDQDVTYTL